MNIFKPNTKNLKVLTPDGYKFFSGIQKLKKQSVEILFIGGKQLRCAKTHRLCTDLYKMIFREAADLQVGDVVYGDDDVYKIKSITDVGEIDLYDIVGVEDAPCYYTNGILSHNCEFLNIGDSAIDEELFKKMLDKTSTPQWSFENGQYKIWKEPIQGHSYVQGVDIGEGIGQNATVVEIFDITDLTQVEQVAEYWSTTISPQLFTNKLHEILVQWGKPPQLIERNNCGAQVVDGLQEHFDYPFIVNWGVEKYNSIRRANYSRAGVISHTNVKFAAVQNMRYWTNDIKQVIVHGKELVMELKNFVRQPNGTWQAKPLCLDDRTMAYVWALNMLDPLCCQGYYEILEYDIYGKPKQIIPNYTDGSIKSKMFSIREIESGQEIIDHETPEPTPFIHNNPRYRSQMTDQIDKQIVEDNQNFSKYMAKFNMDLQRGWTPVNQTQPQTTNYNMQAMGWNMFKQ